jgi:putative ATPase
MIGLPEGRIALAQAVTYLACAKKSNASYIAIDAAINDVQNQSLLPVPVHLRDRHYQGAERLGHGEGYEYPHSHEGGYVVQDYLGVPKEYYQPVQNGYEIELAKRLADIRRLKEVK